MITFGFCMKKSRCSMQLLPGLRSKIRTIVNQVSDPEELKNEQWRNKHGKRSS